MHKCKCIQAGVSRQRESRPAWTLNRTENAWRFPTRLMEVSAVRSAVLRDRNFSLTESSSLKGPLWSPARTIERSQEGTRGDLEGFILLAPSRNLTMRSCFPRDRPSMLVFSSMFWYFVSLHHGQTFPPLLLMCFQKLYIIPSFF